MTSKPAAALTSVIIFSNDATELTFSDGTKLELSPCGASFVCQRPTGRGQHALGGEKRIQQRTEFATNEFKDKVRQALECRNRFAEHPYLCHLFLCDETILQLFADIKAVKWPKHAKNLPWKTQANGSVKVTSIDECASLFLSANKQEFTVEFLCKLSQKELPKRPVKRQAKFIQGQSVRIPQDDERPTTEMDLASNIERVVYGGSSEQFSQTVCVQDSPYMETLVKEKESPRKSKCFRYCSQVSSDGYDENDTGSCSKMECPQGVKGQSPAIEKFIAIKHGYTWVVQHHAVEHCPECWRHPLHLALNFVPEENSGTPPEKKGLKVSFEADVGSSDKHPAERRVVRDVNIGKKKDKKILQGPTSPGEPLMDAELVTSPLPDPLPLSCGASHLHKWRKDASARGVDLREEDIPAGKSIKVWFSNGHIFRLSRTPHPSVQIYPGDGTVIKSTGGKGGFFTHIIPQGGSLDERMLCVRNPPPDCPRAKYSIAGVLRKASRLLQNTMQAELGLISGEENCCWKANSGWLLKSPNTTVVLEESKIEGLGQFIAFSNGKVRVVFSDRTTLDMEWDFRNRVDGNGEHQNKNVQNHPVAPAPRIRKSCFESILQKGCCQLLLPNGDYKLVCLDNPQEYERHVKAAVEWASWVASSPEERVAFYAINESSLSQHDWAVQKELQKIKCFGYILDIALLPDADRKLGDMGDISRTDGPLSRDVLSRSVPPTDEPDDLTLADTAPDFVVDALRRTSHTIQNIDSLLDKF
ncbi:uncharacterized protein C5orf34 homolog isoform X2 [Acanthaster planci]|uniref:Uncharacterized protein C5orf34 homolog isoform X2 n=1 Tax=Acanthaster planci TaxID=133434 RepID=A0A8B7YZD7_ACAPL|nr:uncharacterized protein C5orf34 homolog isoform X2 [Acanthaster planci]